MTVVRAEQENGVVTGGPPPIAGEVVASSRLRQFAADGRAAMEIALSIAPTPFVPESYKKFGPRGEEKWWSPERVAQNVAAAWLAGDEIGLRPMQALQAIDVIEGRPALNARAMRALVQAAGHEVWVEEQPGANTDTQKLSVTVAGKRRGSEHEERVVWTWQRASQANLTGKKNWRNSPIDMLIARATSAVCRLIASDVLMGLAYSQEELQDEAEVPVEEAPVTVRRSRVGAKQPEADPFDEEEPKPNAALAAAAAQPREFVQNDSEGQVLEPGSGEALLEAARVGAYPGYTEWTAEQVEPGGVERRDEAERQDAATGRLPDVGQREETEQCGVAKPDGTAVCNRPTGHEGRHYYGRAVTAEPPTEECEVCGATKVVGEPCQASDDHERILHDRGQTARAVSEYKPTAEELAAAEEGPDADALFSEPSEEEQAAAAEADRAEREAAQAAAGAPVSPVGEPGGQQGPVDEDDDPWKDFR